MNELTVKLVDIIRQAGMKSDSTIRYYVYFGDTLIGWSHNTRRSLFEQNGNEPTKAGAPANWRTLAENARESHNGVVDYAIRR